MSQPEAAPIDEEERLRALAAGRQRRWRWKTRRNAGQAVAGRSYRPCLSCGARFPVLSRFNRVCPDCHAANDSFGGRD